MGYSRLGVSCLTYLFTLDKRLRWVGRVMSCYVLSISRNI